MKKYLILILSIATLFACETKDNYIDTGISNGVHDGDMMDYFASDSYNWDSTILVIERAGLESIFNGTDSNYDEITFLGPTNHSIRRWMLENGHAQISDLDPITLRDMVLKHIIKGKYMKDDIPAQNHLYGPVEPGQDGGVELTAEGGNRIFAYTQQLDYEGVPRSGAIVLRFYSLDIFSKIPVASADIQCDNGVVHSLNYTYTFGGL